MNCRKFIGIGLCCLAVALFVMFLFALYRHSARMARIKYLPQDTLVSIYGEEFRLDEVQCGSKTALMFFSHDCEFCRKEIEGIVDNAYKMLNVSWVFVTPSPVEDVNVFLGEYYLDKLPYVKICCLNTPDLFVKFDVSAPPALFIYDENGELMKYQKGAVSISEILKWLE